MFYSYVPIYFFVHILFLFLSVAVDIWSSHSLQTDVAFLHLVKMRPDPAVSFLAVRSLYSVQRLPQFFLKNGDRFLSHSPHCLQPLLQLRAAWISSKNEDRSLIHSPHCPRPPCCWGAASVLFFKWGYIYPSVTLLTVRGLHAVERLPGLLIVPVENLKYGDVNFFTEFSRPKNTWNVHIFRFLT